MNNLNFVPFIEEDSMKNHAAEEATLREIFDLMQDWIDESRNPETPVINYFPPNKLSEKLDFGLRKEGGGNEHMLEEVKHYLTYAVGTANPAYLNQLFGGFGFPGFVGELITALTNTSLYTYEVAPVATLMEK